MWCKSLFYIRGSLKIEVWQKIYYCYLITIRKKYIKRHIFAHFANEIAYFQGFLHTNPVFDTDVE